MAFKLPEIPSIPEIMDPSKEANKQAKFYTIIIAIFSLVVLVGVFFLVQNKLAKK